MARAKRTAEHERHAAPEREPAVKRQQDGVVQREVSEGELFEALPVDAEVAVFRLDEDSHWSYHGKLLPTEATCERVAALFGGGRYRAHMRSRNDMGKPVIKAVTMFRVAGEYLPPKTLPGIQSEVRKIHEERAAAGREREREPMPPNPYSMDMSGTDPRSILEAGLVSEVLSTMRTSKEMLTRPPMDWSAVIAAATPIIVAFLERQREPAVNPAEIAKQITDAVKEAVSGVTAPQQPVNVVKQVVEAMEALKAVGNHDEGDRDPMFGNLASLAARLLDQGQRTPAPAPAAPAAPVVGEVWQRVLAQHGPRLVQFAAMGASPVWAAETAITLMPPDIREPMTTFLFRDDVMNLLVGAVPRLASFSRWTQDFVFEARAILRDEDAEPEPEPDEPDGGDV